MFFQFDPGRSPVAEKRPDGLFLQFVADVAKERW